MSAPDAQPAVAPGLRPVRLALAALLVWGILGALLWPAGPPPAWLATWWAGGPPVHVVLSWLILAGVAVLIWRPDGGLWPVLLLAGASLALARSGDDGLLFGALFLSLGARRPWWVTWGATLALAVWTVVGDHSAPLIPAVVAAVAGTTIGAESRARTAVAARLAQLERAREGARDDVRQWVARELHDVVGHQLSLILLRILGHREVTDTVELRAMLQRCQEAARAGLDELRLLLESLRTPDPVVDDAVPRLGDSEPGVAAGAEALARSLEAHGFAVSARVTGDWDRLDPTVARSGQRILTEAATNVLRYAPPGAPVGVLVSRTADEIVLEVRNPLPADGGRGAALSGGVGLRGIGERVRLLGGRFEAGPRGRHWVLRATIPQRGAAEAPGRGWQAPRPLRRLVATLRASPGRSIVSVLLLFLLSAEWTEPNPLRVVSEVATVAVALLLTWRPAAGVVAATVLMSAAAAGLLEPTAIRVAHIFLAMAAVAWLPWRYALLALGLDAGFVAYDLATTPGTTEAERIEYWPVVAAFAAVGLVVRLVGRQATLRRERLRAATAATDEVRADERERLALELHDLVTRQLTLVALQGMSYADAPEPATLHAALDRVEAASREALADLRTLVGVLRGAAPQAALTG